MDIENLEKGMVIKSYRELCDILGIKITTGNSKMAQIKEIERFVKYNKEGNKFIIEEIYETPKESTDGRVVNKLEQRLPIEKSILAMIEESSSSQICLPKYVLCEALGLINNNYRYYNYNQKPLYEYLNVRSFDVEDFYNCTNSSLTYTLTKAIDSLVNKNLITCQVVMVARMDKTSICHEITDENILKDILNIQNKAMKEVGCESISETIYKNIYGNYIKIVNKNLSSKLGFAYVFNSYKMTSTRGIIKDSLDTEYKDVNTDGINKEFLDRAIANISGRHDKSLESEMQNDKMHRNSRIAYRRLSNYKSNSELVAMATIDRERKYEIID